MNWITSTKATKSFPINLDNIYKIERAEDIIYFYRDDENYDIWEYGDKKICRKEYSLIENGCFDISKISQEEDD